MLKVTPDQAADRARELFLDDSNGLGCAETAFVVLKQAYGLPEASDPSAAMVLNGGLAYGGGTCGALTGAAMAVGLLAARGSADHADAKRAAREAVGAVMDGFRDRFGALDCRTLTGRDIRSPEAHRAFVEDGKWRVSCMAQLEFVVRALAAPGLENDL